MIETTNDEQTTTGRRATKIQIHSHRLMSLPVVATFPFLLPRTERNKDLLLLLS
jgi:hypothetical protein